MPIHPKLIHLKTEIDILLRNISKEVNNIKEIDFLIETSLDSEERDFYINQFQMAYSDLNVLKRLLEEKIKEYNITSNKNNQPVNLDYVRLLKALKN